MKAVQQGLRQGGGVHEGPAQLIFPIIYSLVAPLALLTLKHISVRISVYWCWHYAMGLGGGREGGGTPKAGGGVHGMQLYMTRQSGTSSHARACQSPLPSPPKFYHPQRGDRVQSTNCLSEGTPSYTTSSE